MIREYMLNSEELMDRSAVMFLQAPESRACGLIPCRWIRFNDRIKLAYDISDLTPLASLLPTFSLDALCVLIKEVLTDIEHLEQAGRVSLENVIWDTDSVYLDEGGHVRLICLPALIQDDFADSMIYKKRIYALVMELLLTKPGGDQVARQAEYRQEQDFGNWEALRDTLDRRVPEEDEILVLRSVNTPQNLCFRIGHESFAIGSDPAQCNGVIAGTEIVSPLHAVIGWNDISFYIEDKGSTYGTYVNDQRIAPLTEVPVGSGTVIRFADYTFSVE